MSVYTGEHTTLESLTAHYERLVKHKQLQIDALLDVSRAINNNFPTSALLRIYEFTLKAQFSVSKLLVFIKNERWECACASGVSDAAKQISVENILLPIEQMKELQQPHPGIPDVFDVIIPVIHQKKPLAYVLIGGISEGNAHEEQLKFIQTLTNVVIVAVENRKLLRAQIEQEVLKKEMEMAAEMQSLLFPHRLPNDHTIQMDAIYLPHHDIGGDYYDLIPLPDGKQMFCVGDISGKGIAAALLMANFQANLRLLAKNHEQLMVFIEVINDIVSKITKGEKFITLFLGVYNPAERTLCYVNAGHNPSMLVQNGSITELKKGCTVLGMFDDLPYVQMDEVKIEKNALLINYTDGLTDFENERGEFYGLERLEDFVLKNQELDAVMFNKTLLEEVNAFKGQGGILIDDITLLTCRFP